MPFYGTMSSRGFWVTRLIHHCAYCNLPIKKGEKAFRGTLFLNQRTFTFNWHFTCYPHSVSDYLASHPPIPKPAAGGRPPITKNPAAYKARRAIQSRIQRRKEKKTNLALRWNLASSSEHRLALEAEMSFIDLEILDFQSELKLELARR